MTAGASAPEELVDEVISALAPATGVELVRVTEEDEYFPPPRNIRDLQARSRPPARRCSAERSSIVR